MDSEEATPLPPTSSAQVWWQRLKRYPLLVLMMLATGLVIPLATRKTQKPGEWYPFSNFPMYSSFDAETYYVYVTDLADKTLPVGQLFGLPISNVKKAYDTNLSALKKETGSKELKSKLAPVYKEEAAVDVLAKLIKNAPVSQRPYISTLSGLRLHQVDVAYDGERIVKTTVPVGEMVLNTAATAPR
jgi:hypothetical protein